MEMENLRQPDAHEREVAAKEAEETGRAPTDPAGRAIAAREPSEYEKEVEAEREGTTAEEVEREEGDRGKAARWFTG